jgi:glycosyltransferase involved in cell wall biosynthesis
MNILQIMGCTSDQYASLEHYLVLKAKTCRENGSTFVVAYNNVPASQDFINDLRNQGAVLIKLEANSILNIAFYVKFIQILKKYKIDILHAYFAPTRHYAVFSGWLFGVKKRYRQAANLPLSGKCKSGLKYKLFLLRHRILASFATKYICRSDAVRNEYLEIGIKPEKLCVADGGADIEKYRKLEVSKEKLLDFYPGVNRIIIGTASRLVKGKGIPILLESISKLKNEFDIICLILGDGPEMKALAGIIKDYGLINHVKLLGHKNEMEMYYNILDVYVSPSFSEGMSNSVLEAMACEVPVVLSDIEPNKEIIRVAQNQNLYVGELFKVGDPEDLYSKLASVLEKNQKEEIGKNARKIIADNFSINHRISKEFKIYKMQK